MLFVFSFIYVHFYNDIAASSFIFHHTIAPVSSHLGPHPSITYVYNFPFRSVAVLTSIIICPSTMLPQLPNLSNFLWPVLYLYQFSIFDHNQIMYPYSGLFPTKLTVTNLVFSPRTRTSSTLTPLLVCFLTYSSSLMQPTLSIYFTLDNLGLSTSYLSFDHLITATKSSESQLPNVK